MEKNLKKAVGGLFVLSMVFVIAPIEVAAAETVLLSVGESPMAIVAGILALAGIGDFIISHQKRK